MYQDLSFSFEPSRICLMQLMREDTVGFFATAVRVSPACSTRLPVLRPSATNCKYTRKGIQFCYQENKDRISEDVSGSGVEVDKVLVVRK